MDTFSTSAIMLRRIDFGDYDLIITFLTLDMGKVSVIAKSAKRSKKRFSGILDLFSVFQVVCSRGKGLPVLQEAVLRDPFIKIRSDIKKTAYASYWAELINGWSETEEKQARLYHLFYHVLESLETGNIPDAAVSILFQMQFMTLAGFYPNLNHCGICGIEADHIKKSKVIFDLVRGEIICEKCVFDLVSGTGPMIRPRRLYLSKGTMKQLLWIGNSDLEKAARVRFSPSSLKEGLELLEAFVPYHLGRTPRSLSVLRQIR